MPEEDKYITKKDHQIIGGGGLKEKKRLAWGKSLIVVLATALVGGFLVWGAFATSASEQAVNTYYNTVVGHNADAGGLAYWSGKLDNAKTTDEKNKIIATMVAMLRASSEGQNYAAKSAAANQPTSSQSSTTSAPATSSCGVSSAQATSTVNALYKKYFPNRAVDSAGVTYWVGQLTSCSKTVAQIEAFFKSKATPAATTAATNNGASQAVKEFPTRSPGDSDAAWRGKIYQWIQGQWHKITGGCCGGLGGGDDWVSRIVDKGWTPEQVYKWLDTNAKGAPNTYKYILANPDSPEAKAYNLEKKFREVYMAELQKYIDSGNELRTKGGLIRTNCKNELDLFNKGWSDIVFYTCWEGTGLKPTEIENWVHLVKTNQITFEEAVAAIKNKDEPSFCSEMNSEVFGPCTNGSRFVSSASVQEAEAQLQARLNDSSRSQQSQNTTNSENREIIPSSPATANTAPSLVVESTDTAASPYAAASAKAKPLSSPAQAINTCINESCAILPVGKTKATEAKKASNIETKQLTATSSCDLKQQLICNDYAQLWDDGGSTTIQPTEKIQSTIDDTTVAKCINQTATLRAGTDDVCTRVAKRYLGLTGYSEKVEDTSEFDQSTQKAVKEFQNDQELDVNNGDIDQVTWKKFVEVAADIQQTQKKVASDQQILTAVTNGVQRTNFATLFPTCSKMPTLKINSTGDCVKRVQQILGLVQTVGLPVNGKLDKNTEKSLKEYQSTHNLDNTGAVDKKTWKLLEAAKDTQIYKSPYQGASGTLLNGRK